MGSRRDLRKQSRTAALLASAHARTLGKRSTTILGAEKAKKIRRWRRDSLQRCQTHARHVGYVVLGVAMLERVSKKCRLLTCAHEVMLGITLLVYPKEAFLPIETNHTG